MDRIYIAENTQERKRLHEMTASLSDEDLNRLLKNGWTVSTTLIHLAFWDQYYLALLDGWEHDAPISSPATASLTSRGLNVDAINRGIERISLSIPQRMAIELVRTAAESIDQRVEGISPDFAEVIEQSGHARLLRRSIHRREHLDQIEAALQ